jgi:catechol 2,3-dioxygenase-like lactoylglutathione lyase family enzyme
MKAYRSLIAAGLVASLLAAAPIRAKEAAPAPNSAGPRMGTMPQQFYMTKIMVSDVQRSYDFYTRVVGLKPVISPDLPMPVLPKPGDPEKDFFEFPLNNSGSMAEPMFVLFTRRGQAPSADKVGVVSLGFAVPDVVAAMDRAAKAGVMPARPFMPERRIGFIKDPDGYTIEFVQTRPFGAK